MAHGTLARLTALALATGTLCVTAAASPASAAAPESRLSADGVGSALVITINLPAQLAGTPLGKTIKQTISLTNGSVSTVSGPLATTKAVLGEGTTPVLSQLLDRSTAAALTGQREQSNPGLVVDQLGVKASILPLLSKVSDPAKDGVLAHSTSGVAKLSLSGLALPQLDELTAPVADVLETATAVPTTAADTTGSVASTVTGAVDTLNKATTDAGAPLPAPVQEVVDEVVATLTDTLTDLTGTVDLLADATDIVSLDSVVSEQTISRKGSVVTSTVDNTVKNVNVLNGLVKIDAIESTATAIAGGKPGTADASFKPVVLNVSLADGALQALIDDKGLTVAGDLAEGLPVDLAAPVNEALNAVNGLLADTIGLDVELGKGATSVSPDGTASAAEVAATTVTVNPPVIADLLAGEKFLTLELVKAQASVGNRLVAAPTVTPATPVTLPRTGGELPLTGAVATALVGAALVVRRRRAGAVS